MLGCGKAVNPLSSVVSDSSQTHRLELARLLSPWDFPGKDTGRGCHFLLQGIFPTQGSNLGLLHCREILYLYRLSHREAHLRVPAWNVSFISNSCKRGILVPSYIPLSWVSLLWMTTLSNMIWNNLTCPKIRGGASGKEPTCQCRRTKGCEFDPWIRKSPWRRAWQPVPVFLREESHGQRSLPGYRP